MKIKKILTILVVVILFFSGLTTVGLFSREESVLAIAPGNAWMRLSNGLPLHDTYKSLAMDPSNPSVLYAGTNQGGVYKTTDGGAHWSSVSNGLPGLFVITHIVIDPHNTQTLYLSTYGMGVYKTTDGGAHWNAVNNGFPTNKFMYALAIDPVNSQTLYAGFLNYGIYKTTDGGAHWSSVGTSNVQHKSVLSIAIDPHNTQTVYLSTYVSGIYKTTDGGVHWSSISNSLPVGGIYALTIDRTDTQTVYAGIYHNNVYKTTDGGAHWVQVRHGVATATVKCIAINPLSAQKVYAGTYGRGVLKTEDGGANWATMNTGLFNGTTVESFVVNALTGRTFYIATDKGIYMYDVSISAVCDTDPASRITQTTATLNGNLTDLGTATSATVYFEYGTSASYGHTTHHQILNATGTFSVNLSFLKPDTAYHFRAVAVSSAGTSYGRDRTLKTLKVKQVDTTPPSISIPEVNMNFQIVTNSSTFSFTLIATDNSGTISRTVIKDNGITIKDVYGLPEGNTPMITLFEGENNIEVTVYDFYGNYASKKFTVISDTKAPAVKLTTTIPVSVSSNTLTVKGTAYDKVTGIKSFTINGKPVSVSADNSFKASISLKSGINNITIEVADKAGNTLKKTYTVSFINSNGNKSKIVTLHIGNPFITINGTKQKIDAQDSKPIIKNNRTLIPIRSLIEALGGTIEWNGKTREVTIQLNGNTIILTIDKSTALANGINTPIDPRNNKVVPVVINGRTYLPLRFIVEHLGCTVDWNPATRTITVYYFG